MSDQPTPSAALGRITKETIITDPRELTAYLTKNEKILEAALPDHLEVGRFIRTIATAFSTTPKLRQCTAFSILQSAVLASQIGLEIGVTGQGYLVPYGKNCTFVPGWQGLVGLLNNSGRATAWTGAVFEGDTFDFELGASPRCRHIPGDNYGDPDLITHFYGIGKVNGSDAPIIEVFTRARVEKHRNRNNKVENAHYSFQHFEMYGRKVVLLQVLKYLPRSIRLNNGVIASNADDSGRSAVVNDQGIVIDIDASEVDPESSLAAAAEQAAPAPSATPEKAPRQTRKKAEQPAPQPEADQAPAGNPEPAPAPAKAEEKPAPAPAAPPAAAPAEKTDAEIRKDYGNYLKEILTENRIRWVKFEDACRKAGIVKEEEKIETVSTAKLKLIADNAGAIIEAIIAEIAEAEGNAEEEESPFGP